jgi:hypothetical protein
VTDVRRPTNGTISMSDTTEVSALTKLRLKYVYRGNKLCKNGTKLKISYSAALVDLWNKSTNNISIT